MGLATPIAIWGSLNALARRGLVARSSDFIERLSVVDTVIFDKTGTLSEDQLCVADFVCAKPESRSQLQSWVSAIEAQCHHPVAAAFAVWPRAAVAVENFQLSPGEGVSASLLGHRIDVGRTAGEGAENLRMQVKAKGLEIFIRVDGKTEGLAILREKARDGVPQVWAALKALDLRVGIMTGDRTENAAQLGLENIESGLMPEEKTARVRALQAEGRRVLFVGDGVNDAGALIEATAGVALTSGSALARETAKAELFGSNLASLPYAIALARQVRSGLRRNLWIAALYNLGGVALAATGLLHPVIAALLMLAASATVTWRALSLAEKLQAQAENSESIGGETCSKRRWSLTFLCRRDNSVALLLGVGVGLQGLLLVYLGQLEPRTTVVLGLTSVLLACLVTAFWRRWNEAPIWQMAVAMFSIGNVAMLLGWWADVGFGAIVRDGLCLCGCAKSDLGLGLIAKFNWMQAGMLASAFPMTWVLPRQAYPLSRWRHALWMAAGMLAGMWLAGAVMTQFSIWDPHRHFLLTYLAMTIGMLTGMMAVCRYGRGVVTL
jgi:phosphoglycolate phosphatase-like HAD superfamily hydrolase